MIKLVTFAPLFWAWKRDAITLIIIIFNPIPRWGEEVSSPPHQFFLNNFFCKNRINLKLLDFLRYTYTHSIHFKNLKVFDYSSVDIQSWPKLAKMAKKRGFWATKATVKHFYDLKYLNLTKSRLSNQKSGMVLEVTLIQNSTINIITKFQVSIFKNYKVRGGKKLPPPTWNKLAQRQHGIGLMHLILEYFISCIKHNINMNCF